jgi:hypothetical protein
MKKYQVYQIPIMEKKQIHLIILSFFYLHLPFSLIFILNKLME